MTDRHPRQGQRCRACNRPFVFFPHERTRKLAPLIASESGNIAVNDDGTYRVIRKDEQFAGVRYVNHFADCPDAATFRGGLL